MFRLLPTIFLLLTADVALAAPGESEYAACIACHGAKGEGNPALNSPALAGQDAAYLERQLLNFRNGQRGADPKDTFGAQMGPMTATLASEKAVTDVAAYIAAMPALPSGEEPVGDLRNGENQYNGACGACHGSRAQGNTALNAPRLAGLDSTYLKRQYRNYGAGVRGAHPEDRLGRQMAMMANMLSTEKDLDDVIAFIHASSRAE
jgi:cytochrome c oxidase subunit 2